MELFCTIFGCISPLLEKVAGETFSSCFDFNDNMDTLEKKIRDLTSKVSDIKGKVELSSKKIMTMEVENWMKNVRKSKDEFDELKEAGFCRPLCYGSRVIKVIEGIEELIQQSQTFREVVADAYETSTQRLVLKNLLGGTFDQNLENIMALFEAESHHSQIIGIWGMGGVGKTTLAGHIWTHLQTSPGKFHVYWVTISQNADINKLQNDLAKNLNLDDFPKDGVAEEKAAILHALLAKRENVVLIVDDVWNYFELHLLGVDGCRVIMTSRSLDVCNQMGCKQAIKIQPLSDEEAWGLFLKKLDPTNKLNPEVEEVAMEMANKCGGLPLAIATVARSMKGVDNIRRWRNALAELKHSMRHNYMKNEVFPILLYSYKRLDEKLQQCFLYCSLYPEDYGIPRNELVTKFIYEGITNERDSWSGKLDLGHTILDELVNVCLLENVKSDSGEEKERVKMHDLLREMAVEITRINPKFMAKAGLYLNELPYEEEWTEDLDKVSLMWNQISKIPEGILPRCPRLSTLILSNNPLTLIPDSFFALMNFLRVLDLSSTLIEELPSSISELENLTTLLLGNCEELRYVPPLNKLKELRELDMSKSKIKKVPEGLECLVKLQYLNMSKMEKLEEIPRELLSRISSIQQLMLPYQVKVDVKEVESLKLLETFEGTINDMWNSKWFNKYPPLTRYQVLVGQPETDIYDYDENAIIFNHYSNGGPKDLLLPRNMKNLLIKDYKGLRDCLLDTFPSLYNCKDLKKCWILISEGLESIIRISSNDESLKNLEELELFGLPNFIGLIKMEPGVVALPPHGTLSSLKLLEIKKCHKIKKLFAHKSLLLNLQNLESLEVSSCDQMEEIIGEIEEEDKGASSTSSSSNNRSNVIAFPKLREIHLFNLPELKRIYRGTINCCDTIETIRIIWCEKLERLPFFHVCIDEKPPTPIYIFPKLKRLELNELTELESICDVNMICDSIEYITIKGCKQLSRLPLILPLIDGQPSPPPSLKKIAIDSDSRDWWGSLEWDNPNIKNVLEPFLKLTSYEGRM